MIRGAAASQKICFWVDERDGRGELTSLDGSQISLSGSVNDKEEIAEKFEGYEPDSKRIKLMGSYQETREQNVSEQSSPLGLTLRKTPSFLDLIQVKLSGGRSLSRSDLDSEKGRTTSEDFSGQPIAEKLKASNFRANLLRIGKWERVSIHEGDLVAKCYYAKRKLVWEVLEGGLKSKIEIQWSNISAIRAIFQKNEADILEIELCRAPMFFRETDPQPRKHTLWQTTSDFTGGQAPIYRWHYVQFPEGTLEKHYEKLLQCDDRLFMLSKKPFPTLNSPYFFTNLYGYPDFCFGFNGHRPTSQFPHLSVPSPNIAKFSLAINDSNPLMSVMDCKHQHQAAPVWVQGINNDQNFCSSRKEEQFEEPPWTVSTRLDNPLIYHHQLPYGDESEKNHPPPNNLSLDEVADHLLKDPFASGYSDEQKILAKVKSMYNLLDAAREPIPTRNTNNSYNLNKHFNIGLKCNADGDYNINNHIMLRSMEQSTDSSNILGLLNSLPTQVFNENPLMNLTRFPSSPYSL
ncbi:hypothetical protein NE237_015986 [Protea cynaroides]|uniref:TRF2/HOY1 PH-like domain-containing protein n=1 Tax=Protea cynaroides TaxID=273540 RepID=A0A9Q0QRK8_9MAGN|nr:hypothetical protein NE237_015986 [Protea cynaroides]